MGAIPAEEDASHQKRSDKTPLIPSSESGPRLEQPLLSRMSLNDRRITSSATGFGTQPYGHCVTIDDRKMFTNVMGRSFKVSKYSKR